MSDLTFDITPASPALSIDLAPARGERGPQGPAGQDAFIRPSTTHGAPAVEVTYAERTAVDLDFWPDGNMGFLWNATTSKIAGTGPSGPVNAAWNVGADGSLLDTVLDAEITTAAIIDPDTNYAAGGGILRLPSGRTISVYHGEEAVSGGGPDFTFWSFLGILQWVSGVPTDRGRIVEPNISKTDPDAVRNVEVAGGCFAVVGDWFHVFYRETLANGTRLELSVARCSLAALDAAIGAGTVPAFQKWSGTAWDQPGLGGIGGDILGDTPGDLDPKWFDVVYLEHSEVWMLAYTCEDDGDWGIGCRFSTDLINWTPHREVAALDADEAIYLTLTAPLTLQSDAFDQRSVPGDDVWLFTTRSVNAGTPGGDRWADATVQKRIITVRSPNGIFAEVDTVADDVAAIDAATAPIVAPLTGMEVAPYGLARWRFSSRALRHIVCFGDSMVQGGGIDSKTAGWPDHLRSLLRNDLGVPVHDGHQPILWASTSPAHRWAKSGSWTNQAASASNLSPCAQGNSVIRTTAGSARSLTWTRPSDVPVSRIVVWWVDDSTTATGGWSYSTDGGSTYTTVTPTAPGTPTLKSTTISGLSDPATFIIRNANAAGTLYATPVFVGIDVYGPNPDEGWVIHNAGYAGATLALPSTGCVAADRTGDFGALFDAWEPELIIWGLSNDSVPASYDMARFDTAVDTFLARVGTYADVIAWGFPNQNADSRPTANQDAVRASYMGATVAAGGGAIDQSVRWGTVAESVAAGLMPDVLIQIHPTSTGDFDIATTVARFLRVFA